MVVPVRGGEDAGGAELDETVGVAVDGAVERGEVAGLVGALEREDDDDGAGGGEVSVGFRVGAGGGEGEGEGVVAAGGGGRGVG